jgi:hypothetical protein
MKEDKKKVASSTATSSTQHQQSSSNSDGLRLRTNLPSSTSANPVINASQQPLTNPLVNPNIFYNTFPMAMQANATQNQNPDYLAAQQAAMQAWMQQAYVQYINQYMNMLQLGAQATPLYASAATAFPANYQHLYTQSVPQSSVAGGQTPIPDRNQQNGQQSPPPVLAQPENAPAPENNPPQRRFPNLVVEEPQENRDWLDISYTMFRLMVVLTLIYFYSSPMRCLAVISIGVALYLYRVGVFRNQIRPPQPNQPNNNQGQQGQLNNNNQQQDPNNVEQDGQDQSAQEQNRTSMLVMIRTFILSFIFSLIPETPAL